MTRRKEDTPVIERKRRPRMPGKLLHAYYLAPRGLTIAGFARATKLSRKHVSNIVHGRAAISPDTAVRFATVLDTAPQFWLNLQNAVDIHDARKRLEGGPELSVIAAE